MKRLLKKFDGLALRYNQLAPVKGVIEAIFKELQRQVSGDTTIRMEYRANNPNDPVLIIEDKNKAGAVIDTYMSMHITAGHIEGDGNEGFIPGFWITRTDQIASKYYSDLPAKEHVSEYDEQEVRKRIESFINNLQGHTANLNAQPVDKYTPKNP